MRLYQSIAAILAYSSANTAVRADGRTAAEQPNYCVKHAPPVKSPLIRTYGYVLYRAYEPLDVFGPVDALGSLAGQYPVDIHFISDSLAPITTRPLLPSMNPHNSSSFYEVLPTTTFDTAPNLDVLIVPGGLGSRSPSLNSTLDFITDQYPKVKYIMSVCTGALLLSRAGVLDGKKATTNKAAFRSVAVTNDNVEWIPHARWVTDGNIWTTSGVSAGIDGMLAFIQCMYGDTAATKVAQSMEYDRHTNANWDPFAQIYNLTEV